MEGNPYARAADSSAAAPGAPAVDPEKQKLADYEAAVDKNTNYFIPKFEGFDAGGSRVGWNWPAFFLTGPYFLYRKMWLWAVLYIFYPFILAIVVGIGTAVVVGASQNEAGAAVVGLVALLLYFAPWILLPMFANSLYWRKVNKLIEDMPSSVASQPDKRARRLAGNGGTNIVIPLVVYLVGGVFGVGMLAAISIPAYQDYTIRAQVTQGLGMAVEPKALVAEHYHQHKAWPANNEAAAYSGATGDYVSSLEIDQGAIIITYGNKANSNLLKEGGRLVLTPALTPNGDVVWVCGNGPLPDGAVLDENAAGGSEIANKYLPSSCRGG
jgi:type IV pilus assembly protein PilA